MTVSEAENKSQRKVRAELNIERWQIWLPSNSNLEPKPRTIVKEKVLENGEKLVSKIEISATTRGVLTTQDQKTLYALYELWEEKPRDDGYVYISLRKLLKRLRKPWGTRNIETVKDSLLRLSLTTFAFTAYFQNEDGKSNYEEIEKLQILEKLKIITKSRHGHTTRAEGYFKFDENIVRNLKNGYTKPVLFDVVLNFKSEIAQIIYTQIDRTLSKKKFPYHKLTKQLFKELGLSGSKYKYPSGRKQALDRAIPELLNLPMSNGAFIESVYLEKTKDEKDFKLMIRRGNIRELIKSSNVSSDITNGQRLPVIVESASEAQYDFNTDRFKSSPEVNLIDHFTEQFSFGDNQPPVQGQKQYNQAKSLISKHGEDLAKYIVEFAAREARKTNFKAQQFGAIFQYEQSAVKDYTDNKIKIEEGRIQSIKDQERKVQEDLELKRWELGFELFRDLSEKDSNRLLKEFSEKVKTEDDFWRNKEVKTNLEKNMFEDQVKAEIRQYLLSELDNFKDRIR